MTLRRRLAAGVAFASLLGLAGPGGTSPTGIASVPSSAQLRVFAIGYKHLLSDAESYDSYRSHLRALADAAHPEGRSDPDGRPRIFLFPEDSALYAMFTGLRGLPARSLEPVLRHGSGNGAAVGIATLIAAYQPQAAYYRAKFPEQNLSQARLGLLALTDTLYRSFFETFREIAVSHGAWVVASANLAPARIVTDPLTALLLGDPEARNRSCGDIAPPCAYEATSENVYNQAFVFNPSGALVFNPFAAAREGDLDGAVKKTYLVPTEEGPLERGKIGLDLSYGDVRQVRAIDIAGMPMGIVISKPAWMLDELGRLEAYGARVILQPEAFSSWGSPVADWSPDVLKQSGWSHVQKHAAFRSSVLAELTGNFFDLVFDGQGHIVTKATAKSAGAARYVGQPRDVGWTAVAPWVVGDGAGETCGSGGLAARRACLAAVGEALAPASGDRRENGYAEASISDVVDLSSPLIDPTRAPGALGVNVRVDDAPAAAHAANPQVATGTDGARYVVWQDDRGGVDQIRIARVGTDGVPGASRAVAPRPGVRQILPRVAVGASGAIHVVWQELDPRPGLRHSVAPDWEAAFGPARAIGAALNRVDEGWTPAIALDGNERLHVAWIALAKGFERLVATRIISGNNASVRQESRFIDAEAFPADEPLAERLNNRWNPAVSARGERVVISWTDFRAYSWDLYATVSDDGGASFGPHLRVDDATRIGGESAGLERLQNDPSVSLMTDGTVIVAWTDQCGRRAGCTVCSQQRRPDTDIAAARLAPGADRFDLNVRVDDTGDGLRTEDRIGFSNQWRPSLVADPSGVLIAVWQDHRTGNNDIYLGSSTDGGRTWGPSRRVDDTGDGWSNQYRPSAAVDQAGRLSVVWQDDRDGADHVYLASGTGR
jgi:hypothetical protein